MKIVHFGSGNIGRGAIPEIFDGIYDELIFIDLDEKLIDKINKSQQYIINKSSPLVVKNFRGIYLKNTAEVIWAINHCELISTSCGFDNLYNVATIINQSNVSKKIPIVSFENNVRPSSHLKSFINKADKFNFVDCIIDRIVPNQINASGLNVTVEDYLKVIVETGNYNLDYFKNCQIVDNLDEYITLKLYGVNGLHYVLAILGFNEKYQYIKDLVGNKDIIEKINFYCQCLVTYISSNTKIDKYFIKDYLSNNIKRFLNPDLLDQCSRVARNSLLKLKSQNRVIPVIRYILDLPQDLKDEKTKIINLLKDLYSYNNIYDKDSRVIQKSIIDNGLNATIIKYSKIKL